MGYDFAIWKRSSATKTAMLQEVYDAICEQRDHPAMAPFDWQSFVRDLEQEFNSPDPDWRLHWVPDSSGDADWVFVHCAFDAANEVAQRIVPLVMKYDYLLLYDPQRTCVSGNRRPPPLKKAKAKGATVKGGAKQGKKKGKSNK